MTPTENGIFNYKVFKGFTRYVYCFAIDEKQLPPVSNVPMLQSFFSSIILPIRKPGIELSHILLPWKKSMKLVFSYYLGAKCTKSRAHRLNTYDRLRYLHISTTYVKLFYVLIKKKSVIIKTWNGNDCKSWKGYICRVSSSVDQKCINVLISLKDVYSVRQSEGWCCWWAVGWFPLYWGMFLNLV